MNCHQVLTGAANAGDSSFSRGTVEGVPFVTYAAGCNIVILASNFQRVQIIPGILHGNVQVTCLDANTDVGKIAAAYGKRICIFEPTPILDQDPPSDHRLDYRWIQTGAIEADCPVNVVNWNLEGTRLLTGGNVIQMWHLSLIQDDGAITITARGPDSEQKPVKFANEAPSHPPTVEQLAHQRQKQQQPSQATTTTPGETNPFADASHGPDDPAEMDQMRWECVWSCRTASPVAFLSFSPDGTLFCSAGPSDRLVKIWYESAAKYNYLTPAGNQAAAAAAASQTGHNPFLSDPVLPASEPPQQEITYSFIYIAHPRAITGISWRGVSKYIPRGTVANMLVTSCWDNICRIWVQTLIPDDGLVNFNQIESLSGDTIPRLSTQRHRNKIMNRLKHMKSFSHFKKRQAIDHSEQTPGSGGAMPNGVGPNVLLNGMVPNLPSTFSVHDFHSFGVHGAATLPGLHFHLAASINAESDIPLVPSLATSPTATNKLIFGIHWLNNKDMSYTQQAEKALHEISVKIFKSEAATAAAAAGNVPQKSDQASEAGSAGDEDQDGTNTAPSMSRSQRTGQPGKPIKTSVTDETHLSDGGSQQQSRSVSSTSLNEMNNSENKRETKRETNAELGNLLDRKLDALQREWHNTADLLFSIHPVDGSLLVWTVDWLDESSPGAFRQAQVSFSSRIPSAIPVSDAGTMSQHLELYAPHSHLDLRSAFLIASSGEFGDLRLPTDNFAHHQHSIRRQEAVSLSLPTPTLFMITKHVNGSVNLWQLGFADKSHYTQMLSIRHSCRICGHRFRVNDVRCHPVLPLCLTTSHHNFPGGRVLYPKSPGSSSDTSPMSSSIGGGIPGQGQPQKQPTTDQQDSDKLQANNGFCSELILWKIDPVGPLSKSGGVTELARINSPQASAFANVAWIPTLLPSTTLGAISNSPSACFIASDGRTLRVYQAVIDGRTLLNELASLDRVTNNNAANQANGMMNDDGEHGGMNGSMSDMSGASSMEGFCKDTFRRAFKVISSQSTARPGCILELSPISDAIQDWKNTQLLHVFQEQLIRGDRVYRDWEERQRRTERGLGLVEPSLGAVVDLRHSHIFEEPFYLVVMEKNDKGQSVVHMWRLLISSHTETSSEREGGEGPADQGRTTAYVPDTNLIQDESDHDHDHSHASSRSGSPDSRKLKNDLSHKLNMFPIHITTTKVCTQVLPLPLEVEVVHTAVAAGHLSSSNIYPACFAPYLICTACSDGVLRFWHCKSHGDSLLSPDGGGGAAAAPQPGMGQKPSKKPGPATVGSGAIQYEWVEWEMLLAREKSSAIQLSGQPVYVSCAYNGRIAAAYRQGQTFSRTATPNVRYMNVNLAIYECESTGGSEWVLEDTIPLRNIVLPQGDIRAPMVDNIGQLVDTTMKNRRTADTIVQRLGGSGSGSGSGGAVQSGGGVINSLHDDVIHADLRGAPNIQRLLSVPSYATMQSLRKIICERGNQFTINEKSLIQLDWVSTEDGSHVLTVSVGSKVTLFTPVSTDIAQANLQAMKTSEKTVPSAASRVLLKQASSMGPAFGQGLGVDEIRWMTLRTTYLSTCDGLAPLPMQMSWVRDGIMIVGLDNEMHVYTQWKGSDSDLPTLPESIPEVNDKRVLTEQGLFSHAHESSNLRLPGPPTGSVPRSPSTAFLGSMPAGTGSSEAKSKQHVVDGVFARRELTPKGVSNVPTSVPGTGPGSQRGDSAQTSDGGSVSGKVGDISNLPDFGIFEAARLACPVLPQYHPKQLMELLAFGKIHRVRAILNHLVTCLCSMEPFRGVIFQPRRSGGDGGSDSERSPRPWMRSRTLSVAAPPMSPNMLQSPNPDMDLIAPTLTEELQLDYTEITSIRPLPLATLIESDHEKAKPMSDSPRPGATGGGEQDVISIDYDPLFDSGAKSQVEEALDEILGRSVFSFSPRNKKDTGKQEKKRITDFGSTEAKILTKLLTHSHLPGLSSLDQMHLLALADSVASFNPHSNNPVPVEKASGGVVTAAGSSATGAGGPGGQPAGKDGSLGPSGVDGDLTVSADSLDDCGLRFLLTMRQHVYLLRCLPLSQRKNLQRSGLNTHNIVWAFHSETQDELIQLIPSVQRGKPKWAELRDLGVGWWIRNNATLKKLFEKIAKAAFQEKNDPLDAALFYMAMRKKQLIWGLFRSIQDKKMTEFFQNNFSDPKWRKAALKNAYALMGKQRFEHAAAFFLLAGNVWDAVEICIDKMDDLQLAMCVIRLYEGEMDSCPASLKKLIYKQIIGCKEDDSDYSPSKSHPDPFLRSMSYWILQEYTTSLTTLLETDIGNEHPKAAQNMPTTATPGADTGGAPPTSIRGGSGATSGVASKNPDGTINPQVFNFYLFLRTHPLIVRRKLAQAVMDRKDGLTNTVDMETSCYGDAITPFERRLFFLTAHAHFRAGCPSLALEVLSQLPNRIIMTHDDETMDEKAKRKRSIVKQDSMAVNPEVATGTLSDSVLQKGDSFDWGGPAKPVKKPSQDSTGSGGVDAFDWGAPTSFAPKAIDTSDFKISLDVLESDEDDDDGGLKMKSTAGPKGGKGKDDQNGAGTSINTVTAALSNIPNKEIKLDIMAQQLKFIACLKIIMEELSTLATGFEVNGGHLRFQLYSWLEKSVQALKHICNYQTFALRSGAIGVSSRIGEPQPQTGSSALLAEFEWLDSSPSDINRQTPRGSRTSDGSVPETLKPTLHEVLLADKVAFEAKLERAHRRKEWLRANESLLRNLMTYCNLHGAHGGGLSSVRMELLLLLQELQQDRSQQQLHSPLPFPTSLPLLAASVASQKTVVADPIRNLQSSIHDILETLMDLKIPPLSLPARYSLVYVLRDLGISLSACVYQSLCDSEHLSPSPGGGTTTMGTFGPSNTDAIRRQQSREDSAGYSGSHLSAGSHQPLKRISSSDAKNQKATPSTPPNKWPGVQSLRALLARDKDEDSPRLHTMLCEAYLAVYMSQLVFSVAACDSHQLFRLVARQIDVPTWSKLFGGGAKKQIHVAPAIQVPPPPPQSAQILDETNKDGSSYDLLNTLSKQRMKLHMKILQQLNQGEQVRAQLLASAGGSGSFSGAPGTGSGGGGAAERGSIGANSGAGVTSSGQPIIREDRPTYREYFIPPEFSLITYFMSKPPIPDDYIAIDYDSSQSVDSEQEDEADDDFAGAFATETASIRAIKGGVTGGGTATGFGSEVKVVDQEVYAWGIIRYGAVKLAASHITQFLAVAGVEIQDLPTISPLIHALFRVIEIWMNSLRDYMASFGGPPPNFLPDMYVESTRCTGPAIQKYKVILDTNNTPFTSHNAMAKASKRLWNYLIRQETVQEIFIRYIFGRQKLTYQSDLLGPDGLGGTGGGGGGGGEEEDEMGIDTSDPVKIVHKDHDSIASFVINRNNSTLIAVATSKEIQEIDISALVQPTAWMEEVSEYDILNLQRGPESLPATDLLVVQHPADRLGTSPGSVAMNMTTFSHVGQDKNAKNTTTLAKHHFPGNDKQEFCDFVVARSRHVLKPLRRHKCEGVRRMAAHPTLSLYISGSQDGSVSLWEWNHQQPISQPRPPGTYAKVTKILFNAQGNKFGLTDGDGNLSLWQVSLSSAGSKPFFTIQAHSKTTSDFAFLASSSLLVTAGQSADHHNVALWDSLLPAKKALVTSFACHEHHGASAVLYAPLNQLLVTGGRKGDAFVFDMRQRTQRNKFMAHENSAVKCMSIDPAEELLATGSADGDIRVWTVNSVTVMLYSFPGEHQRSSIFRNAGMGVSHLSLDSAAHLFSCGADGTMKMRKLPDKLFFASSSS